MVFDKTKITAVKGSQRQSKAVLDELSTCALLLLHLFALATLFAIVDSFY